MDSFRRYAKPDPDSGPEYDLTRRVLISIIKIGIFLIGMLAFPVWLFPEAFSQWDWLRWYDEPLLIAALGFLGMTYVTFGDKWVPQKIPMADSRTLVVALTWNIRLIGVLLLMGSGLKLGWYLAV